MNYKNNIFHIPVMKKEAIYYLNIINNGIYIDGTFGAGGHSKEILHKLNDKGILLACDKDLYSIELAKKILDKRFFINHFSFTNFKYFLKKKNMLGKINGIILDLGLSNIQLFYEKRGFSFMKNEILDMRMDITKGIPAYKWLKNSNAREIEYVFNKFGEEYKYSKKIANCIVNFNKKKNIINTKDLVNIILKIHKKKNKIHPATKYFQAIRIYINNELSEIKIFLSHVIDILNINGRLVTISFNSLESKIIKNFFNIKNDNIINIPLTYNEEKKLYKKKFYMKKIIKLKPSKEEINLNKKSRSAILNVFEKNKL